MYCVPDVQFSRCFDFLLHVAVIVVVFSRNFLCIVKYEMSEFYISMNSAFFARISIRIFIAIIWNNSDYLPPQIIYFPFIVRSLFCQNLIWLYNTWKHCMKAETYIISSYRHKRSKQLNSSRSFILLDMYRFIIHNMYKNLTFVIIIPNSFILPDFTFWDPRYIISMHSHVTQ